MKIRKSSSPRGEGSLIESAQVDHVGVYLFKARTKLGRCKLQQRSKRQAFWKIPHEIADLALAVPQDRLHRIPGATKSQVSSKCLDLEILFLAA